MTNTKPETLEAAYRRHDRLVQEYASHIANGKSNAEARQEFNLRLNEAEQHIHTLEDEAEDRRAHTRSVCNQYGIDLTLNR